MARSAKYVSAKTAKKTAPATDKDNALAEAVAAEHRTRVRVDPSTVSRIATTGIVSPTAYGQFKDEADEEKVQVLVPKAYLLTDDGNIVHSYPPGQYEMRVSHARHEWSVLNGVTES